MATNKIQTAIRFEPELLYKIAFVEKEITRSLNAPPEFPAQEYVQEYEAALGAIPVNDEQLYKK